jgi:hypothetical protein
MEWDVIAVFVLALLFFEGIAYLMWRKGRSQKPGVVEMATLSLNGDRGIDIRTDPNP